jgi:curved DNA-binding protein CbpA
MKARIASAATATHFELLEISQDASAADATAAYMRLVKTWHPDKVPAALAELRSAASTVFAKMTEAHSVWTNATKRQEYLATLASGVSKKDEEELVNRALKAMTEFQKAEVFYRKKDLVNAELCVKNALELDGSQCDYIAFAAWMEASRREDADAAALKRWLGELDRALAIHSKSDRALYYRGMIHKRAGNDKAAQRDFRDACDHNPKNVDAQRELRLFAMRQGASTPPPSPPATGLLGRLFKK